MVQALVHDPELLAQRSCPATQEDLAVAQDLLDTLIFHREACVGMAANMIGVNKSIIVFEANSGYMEMFNPRLLRRDTPYEVEEGCLSLTGTRKAKRYREIKIQWQTREMKTRVKNFSGWTTQIIQHELDHLDGIII